MVRMLIKNPYGCVIFWISLVNVWLMFWSFACCSLCLLSLSLFRAICLALKLLLLLIMLFWVDFFFFCASIKIMATSSTSESAGFQGLCCSYIITLTTHLGWKMGATSGKNATDSQSSYLGFCVFS